MSLGNLVRYTSPGRRVVRRDFDRLVDDLWSGFGLAPIAFAPAQNPASSHGAFSPTFEAREVTSSRPTTSREECACLRFREESVSLYSRAFLIPPVTIASAATEEPLFT